MPYCTVQYSYEYEYRVRAPHGSVTSVLTLSQALHKPSSSPLAAFTGVVYSILFYSTGTFYILILHSTVLVLEPSGPEARARVFVHVLYEFRDY